MEGTVGEKLCAHLTGTVGTNSADEFYNEFTLTDTSYSEYHFKEMKEIFDLPGMDKWIMLHKTITSTKEGLGDSSSSSPIYISLVCFVGIATVLTNSPIYQREHCSVLFRFFAAP